MSGTEEMQVLSVPYCTPRPILLPRKPPCYWRRNLCNYSLRCGKEVGMFLSGEDTKCWRRDKQSCCVYELWGSEMLYWFQECLEMSLSCLPKHRCLKQPKGKVFIFLSPLLKLDSSTSYLWSLTCPEWPSFSLCPYFSVVYPKTSLYLPFSLTFF